MQGAMGRMQHYVGASRAQKPHRPAIKPLDNGHPALPSGRGAICALMMCPSLSFLPRTALP